MTQSMPTPATSTPLLRRLGAGEINGTRTPPVDGATLAQSDAIIQSVRAEGEPAIRGYAERFGERGPGDALVLGRAAMQRALESLDPESCAMLERAAARIERFARAQRSAINATTIAIPGGEAGHTIEPIASAGCYAPNGRYPLPSSVLMTAITARIAGCGRVVVASPSAHPVMLAAAAIAGADEFLAIGGAHAIGALAYGFESFDPVDVIVGPGNRWVTAAKQLVSGIVGIDMLAGPSELLILADDGADPAMVAADLLAQAEHDTDARAILITTSAALIESTERELVRQLEQLPTRDTARAALANGFGCLAPSLDAAIELANTIAPEHLEILMREPAEIAKRIRNAGGLFIGAGAGEVLGDYGAGPNHTLPTAGTARFQAGLSIIHFLRLRTWIRIDDAASAQDMVRDTAHLAMMEGLAGHAASARRRMG